MTTTLLTQYLNTTRVSLTLKRLIVFVLFVGLPIETTLAQSAIDASKALISRVIPSRASSFVVELLPTLPGTNTFEIESRNGKIVLRGNNGVAVASALYHYLTDYCHCQITWNGTNLNLPKQLPVLPAKIQKNSPYTYRYYLNYCTFNYSMSWWDWPRWQKEIDWMALHGINMPLAITGEEYTWNEVYKEMGFSRAELTNFFSGPAYFSWFWMGNLDGWGGPLPQSWMDSHKTLQQQILKQERALGMTPVLPAFTGHVPAAFRQKFPKAKLKSTNWTNGFADTYILDSEDPLFAEIGKRFLEKQTRLFGTDHLYSADTFNENEPPSDDPVFLGELSKRIYEGMRQADKDAVWVMQGWLFYSDRKFWKAPQIEALLKAVPDDKMMLLDLAAEIEPVWKRTDAFYGKPWIWNMLNNFGGNVNLFGRLDGVAANPAKDLNDPKAGRLMGIGLTMEAIEQNPVIYELMMQHTWQRDPIDLDVWLANYARNRYRTTNPKLVEAWQVLRRTAYNGKDIRDGAESIVTGRPTFDSTTVWTRTKLNYPPQALLPAWDLFIEAAKERVDSDGFQYDLVDLTRQVLANYALVVQKDWVTAYRKHDKAAFATHSRRFLDLISDMDRLLASRQDFMLGPWLTSARKWGSDGWRESSLRTERPRPDYALGRCQQSAARVCQPAVEWPAKRLLPASLGAVLRHSHPIAGNGERTGSKTVRQTHPAVGMAMGKQAEHVSVYPFGQQPSDREGDAPKIPKTTHQSLHGLIIYMNALSGPMPSPTRINQPVARLVSLDALRGFDMFWIMSGEHIVHALAKATGWPFLVWLSSQLHHTEWNGCTFYDMIFPLFLFIAGVSMPYSMQGKLNRAGVASASELAFSDKKSIYAAMLKRMLILVFLGMVVNGLLQFKGYEQTRFASVLGRIGLAWFFAGLIYLNTNTRGQVLWLLALLIGYWGAMMLIPVPGFGAGVLTKAGSLESYIDQLLLPGKLHSVVHDPEGILSTIPAIGTALLGVLTGTFLKNEDVGMRRKALWLLGVGVALIVLGLVWNLAFPINKRLWTSSFTVYVGGWSLLFLSLFYYIIDVLGWKKWAFVFLLIGSNSILIYLAAEGAVDFAHTANFIFGGLIRLAPLNWQAVGQTVSVTFLQVLLLYFLYKRKIFLKV